VLDRSVDPVAPVIHEWTYEALVYDLLSLDENIIRCLLLASVRQANDSKCMIRVEALRARDLVLLRVAHRHKAG
jgi:syntaxin-binding protein 1